MVDIQSAVLKDWWDQQHKEKNIKMLTGSGLIDYQLAFGMEFKPGQTVLEIGIGTGRFMTESLVLGCHTYGLDISPVAVEKMNDLLCMLRAKTFCWNTTDYELLPKDFFDVIISRFVAQHMNDIDLLEQLKAVIPCLRKNGVFYLHFYDKYIRQINDILKAQKYGGVPRTRDEIGALVKKAGGKIIDFRLIEEGMQGLLRIVRDDDV